ncbi:MAG: carboxymuconolactone decarboxylase family protein [Halobacterium sp.]
MARVEQLDPEEIDDPELNDIFSFIREKQGAVPNHFKVEANFPEPFVHLFYAQRALWEDGPLSMELVEKIAVAVSLANGCDYCAGAHCTILDGAGADREEILAFQEGAADGDLSAFEQATIDFALQVNDDPHGVTDETIETLRDGHGLSDAALLQLVHAVNVFGAANRVNIVFDTDYDHEWARDDLATDDEEAAVDAGH